MVFALKKAWTTLAQAPRHFMFFGLVAYAVTMIGALVPFISLFTPYFVLPAVYMSVALAAQSGEHTSWGVKPQWMAMGKGFVHAGTLGLMLLFQLVLGSILLGFVVALFLDAETAAAMENIQREDLNPIEVAISYKRLIDECDLTHEGLSDKISKSRSNITNFLRLLKLPAEIQMALSKGTITMGHARALISVEDPAEQLDIFERIINEVLSVRDVENLARKAKKPKANSTEAEQKKDYYRDAKYGISQTLNAKVDMKFLPNGNGKIVIDFVNEHDLNRIIQLLQAPNQNYSY